MSRTISCPPEVLSQLRDALRSLPNPDELAVTICEATSQATLKIEGVSYGLNQLYLLFGTALVFVMHGGFAMLAAGAIRSKNAVNILLQTLMDACASALMWYLLGYGFAYGVGENPNAFIGDALFGLARLISHETGSGTGRWLDVVFNWAFCATAVTIPAGSVAERCNFNAYLCYSTFISAFLYPVVAHWVWCSRGWLGYATLKPLLRCGMIDFAGSSVVHMLGGLSGLAGATLLGPRMGRFDLDNQPVPLPGHSAVLVVLGTILLWFGWYGFNPVSTMVIDTALAAEVASRSAVTTTLAGAAGGVGCLVWTLLRTRTFDLFALCNGVLCGFVAVTAGCHVYEPWAAILCGAGAGIIFDLSNILLLKLNIDDPLGAGPMHGGCGAYGVIFVGLLAKKEYIMQSYTARTSYPYGLFYGGGGRLLACQVIGALVIGGWTLGLMFPFFWILKFFNLLRVPPEEELNGLDISRHYSRAYYLDQIHDASFKPQLTYTTGATGTIAYVKKEGGALGDAIMRAELIGNTTTVGPQQQQQIRTSPSGSAWAVPPAAGTALMSLPTAAAGASPSSALAVAAVAVGETSGRFSGGSAKMILRSSEQPSLSLSSPSSSAHHYHERSGRFGKTTLQEVMELRAKVAGEPSTAAAAGSSSRAQQQQEQQQMMMTQMQQQPQERSSGAFQQGSVNGGPLSKDGGQYHHQQVQFGLGAVLGKSSPAAPLPRSTSVQQQQQQQSVAANHQEQQQQKMPPSIVQQIASPIVSAATISPPIAMAVVTAQAGALPKEQQQLSGSSSSSPSLLVAKSGSRSTMASSHSAKNAVIPLDGGGGWGGLGVSGTFEDNGMDISVHQLTN